MATAQFSSKGQIVIPKAIRDRQSFVEGATVEVVETPAGVLLRLPQAKTGESFETITARIRARNTYHGPPVSIAEMNESIDEMFRNPEKFEPW
ncbi:MAG: AbrB/MazE/SpoVT family DNA-binding domain-containing protein [Sphingomonadaceae bacterium]